MNRSVAGLAFIVCLVPMTWACASRTNPPVPGGYRNTIDDNIVQGQPEVGPFAKP